MTNHYVTQLEECVATEKDEMNLVVMFKPKLSIDGDQYCWLLGDNLQDGVAGFGESPYLAALDFNANFHKKLPEATGGQNHDPH